MLDDMEIGTRRPYRMQARAEAAAATGDRIIEAAIELFGTRFYDDVGLEDVSARAGVSVRTVLRRFGSKDGLFDAAVEQGRMRVSAQRGDVPVGDVKGTIRNLFDHYEEWGDSSLLLLAQEQRVPRIRQSIRTARAIHREWVEHAFEPFLAKRRSQRRERQVMALIAATDVYIWKLLRRDWGLSREEAERTLERMVMPMLESR